MATTEKNAFYVLQFSKTESAITVQRVFQWTPQWTCEHPKYNHLELRKISRDLVPQLEESEPNNFIRQQDNARPKRTLRTRLVEPYCTRQMDEPQRASR
ncbi:hypothetical protein TNCV_3441001 [Trichonephila clavipes]|uniref:Uncharacterized protein n=1 Tax=Trichonephila clavipes TaxID=2585209 RepID=A0A8X6W5M0_TRICX|nr:hypothetical protein TNCV_3441001 [Trichonephila clavipes]